MNDLSISKLIKVRRIELGISEITFAEILGISLDSYLDIERYPEEFFTQISLSNAKTICKYVNLKLLDIVEVKFPELKEINSVTESIPIRDLFKQRRSELGLTTETLADMIGYNEVAVLEVESEENGIDSLAIDDVVGLLTILGIPPSLVF